MTSSPVPPPSPPSTTDVAAVRSMYLNLLKQALTASLYDESGWAKLVYARPPWRALGHPRRWAQAFLKHVLGRIVTRRDTILVKQWPYDAGRRAIGRDFPFFGYTMIGLRRLDNLQHCVERVLAGGVPGDLIETGAWRGGATIFMRGLLRAYGVTDRKVWVADSFTGLPPPTGANDDWDLSDDAYFKVSLDQVRANFARFGLLDEQVSFLPGWFHDTLPNAPIERLAILRLDGDMYQSTLDGLNHLYDKVSPGGFVIVDDYYSWDSCRRAVTEFLAARALAPAITPIDQDAVFWQKT